MKHDLLSSGYKRNIKSAIAEQILNDCRVFVDINILYANYMANRHKKKSSVYKVYKMASTNGGFIRSKYYGRDKITFRIFTSGKEYPNLINESDPIVLKSIKSRYKTGVIVEFDYNIFEYNIIKHTINIDDSPSDIHSFVMDLLLVTRKEAKVIDSALLYGSNYDADNMCEKLVNSKKYKNEALKELFLMVDYIRDSIASYTEKHYESFDTYGCVVNSYGRRIFPRDKKNIFNNVIQSIGSEILIDCVIKINDMLKGKQAHLLFHRFDSLFFDIGPQEEDTVLDIKNTMESINDSLNLGVSVSAGKDMFSIKRL